MTAADYKTGSQGSFLFSFIQKTASLFFARSISRGGEILLQGRQSAAPVVCPTLSEQLLDILLAPFAVCTCDLAGLEPDRLPHIL